MRRFIGVWLLPLMLMVNAAAASVDSAGNSARKSAPFLDASVDNSTPYVGQEVILTYSLLFSGIAPRIADVGKAEPPGLWVREVTPEGYISSTMVRQGDRSLRKAIIKQLKIVPMQAGGLSVSNYRIKCLLPPDNGAGGGQDIETVITSPTVDIVARPLPKGAPEGFDGAVGDFSLAIAPERGEVRVGEAMTLTVRIDGKANLRAFPQLRLELPKGFRQLDAGTPARSREKSGKEDDAVQATFSIVADQPGRFSFTPVRMTVFNPWKGGYETRSSAEVTISVLPSAKPAVTPLPESTPAPSAGRSGWISGFAMIFMAVAVLLLIVLLFLASRKKGKVPPPSPTPSASPATAAGQHSKTASPEILKHRLYDALRDTGIKNPAGLTLQQLRNELKDRQIGAEETEALIEVMQMIDRAVYTPGTTSGEALETMNSKAALALERLTRPPVR